MMCVDDTRPVVRCRPRYRAYESHWPKANGLSSVACTGSSQNGYGNVSRSTRSHPYHASLIALFPLFSSRNCAFSPSAPPPRAPSQPRQFTLLLIPASLPLNPPAAYSATVRAAPRHRPPLTYFRCLPHTFLQEPSPYATHPPNSSPCCCPSPSPVSLQLAPACPIPRLFVPPRKSSRTYTSPPDPVNRITPHSDYPGPPPHLVTTRPAPTLTHVCACTRYTAVLFFSKCQRASVSFTNQLYHV